MDFLGLTLFHRGVEMAEFIGPFPSPWSGGDGGLIVFSPALLLVVVALLLSARLAGWLAGWRPTSQGGAGDEPQTFHSSWGGDQ